MNTFSDKHPVLSFEDIYVDIQGKQILRDVSGAVDKGEILAIMGPSGGGKTTLLNALAGYTPISQGSIQVRGKKINKRVRRRISYVLQSDIFFANLTLRETLIYSALLRLPSEMGFKNKISKVNDVIETLGLQDCQNTIIGSPIKRGLSGGEKKRTNIACEMLTDPFILLLDEPTSGLDSSTAYSLFMTLKKLAHSEGKTVVTSIHQPSSQLFYGFDKLLLIAKGKVAYYGPAKSVMDYFSSVGLHCTLLYNPADYILEMVSIPESRRVLIGPDPPETGSSHQNKWWHKIWPVGKCYDLYRRTRRSNTPSPTTSDHRTIPAIADGDSDPETTGEHGLREEVGKSDSVVVMMEYQEEPRGRVSPKAPLQAITENHKLSEITDEGVSSFLSTKDTELNESKKRVSFDDYSISHRPSNGFLSGGRRNTAVTAYVEEAQVVADDTSPDRKWMNPWYLQFLILCHRTFKQSAPHILSPLSLFQTIALTAVCSIVWFQISYEEKTIQDRYGLLFFTVIYWSFQGCVLAVTAFPSERIVISKERAAGSYHLSAYYLAKTLSELPLIIILPSIFIIFVFPISGIQGAGSFFGTWFTILFNCFTLQSLGLLLGAIVDGQKALVLCIVLLLSSMLVGGFYVQSLPTWITWMKYLSPVTYAYRSVLQFVFTPDIQFTCQDPSEYLSCLGNATDQLTNATKTFPATEVLVALDASTHLALNLSMLLVIALLLRFMAYLALRFLHRREGPQ